jgi:hypothetical protein
MSDVTEKNVTPTVESVKTEPTKAVEKKPEIAPEPKSEPQKSVTVVDTPVRYKLNLYSDSGIVKPIFGGSIMRDVSRKYGDIIRSVSSTRFMTEDEVCESVWTIERKMRYPTNRTRKQIREAIEELLERQIIVTD